MDVDERINVGNDTCTFTDDVPIANCADVDAVDKSSDELPLTLLVL